MFQEGGLATPSMPPSTGGGIVEGLGLNQPEAMPPIPPQEQAMITEGLADMATKIGQVDAAEDTASLINAMRNDNRSLDERYTELAKYVGRKDATATPESVLTLVQPTFELLEQSGGMGMLGSDALQGAAPMEESLTATMTESPMGDTATMTETMEAPTLFNGGGLVKKSKAPVYRQSGSPPQGEIDTSNPFTGTGNPYAMGSGPYRFGTGFPTDPNKTLQSPYFPERGQINTGASPTPGFQTLSQQWEPLNAPYSQRFALRGAAERERRKEALEPKGDFPTYNEMMQRGMRGFTLPRRYTEAAIGETLKEGTVPARSETEIYEGYKDLAEEEGFLTTKPAEQYKTELEALMSPYREEPKTAEQLLKEEEDFVGTIDNSPQALFALAQGFNEMAQTPGKFLGSLAAGSAKAAELLSPLSREQEIFDLQRRQKAFDEEKALTSRIREDKRELAMSAWEMFREDEKGTKAFKQGMFTDALRQAAIESQTEQELGIKIKEIALQMGVDLRTAQIDALQTMYEPMLTPDVKDWGGIYKMVPNAQGELVPTFVGIVGEDANQYFNHHHALTGEDPMVIVAGEDDVPPEILANMGDDRINEMRDKIGKRERAINTFEQLISDIYREEGNIGTGPKSWIKAISTNSLGAFGAEGFTFINNEKGRRRLLEAIRAYQRAETMNPRYPIGEMERIERMVDLDPQFFASPAAVFERLRELSIDLLNSNEYERAILERRAPNRLVNIGSATRNDPADYSNVQFRDMLGVLAEQGEEWSGFVEMTPDDATLADPAINPFGVTKLSELQQLHQDPAYSDLNLEDINKYDQFRKNNNPLKIFLQLERKPDGTMDFTGFERRDYTGATPLDFGFADTR